MNFETIRERVQNRNDALNQRMRGNTGAVGNAFGLNSSVTFQDLLDIFAEPQPAPVRDEQDGIRQCPRSDNGVHEWFDPTNKVVEANGYRVCRRCGALKPPVTSESPKQGGGGEQASEIAKRLANETVNKWIAGSMSARLVGTKSECDLRLSIAAAIGAALAEQRRIDESRVRDAMEEESNIWTRAALARAAQAISTGAAPEEQRRVLGREREKAEQ